MEKLDVLRGNVICDGAGGIQIDGRHHAFSTNIAVVKCLVDVDFEGRFISLTGTTRFHAFLAIGSILVAFDLPGSVSG